MMVTATHPRREALVLRPRADMTIEHHALIIIPTAMKGLLRTTAVKQKAALYPAISTQGSQMVLDQKDRAISAIQRTGRDYGMAFGHLLIPSPQNLARDGSHTISKALGSRSHSTDVSIRTLQQGLGCRTAPMDRYSATFETSVHLSHLQKHDHRRSYRQPQRLLRELQNGRRQQARHWAEVRGGTKVHSTALLQSQHLYLQLRYPSRPTPLACILTASRRFKVRVWRIQLLLGALPRLLKHRLDQELPHLYSRRINTRPPDRADRLRIQASVVVGIKGLQALIPCCHKQALPRDRIG